ncbi:MAG: cytochrome C peroxidase [Deltaproteobacteria bacterium]|nr:cytochrome C peroxidase [Deltaproteobacteria bacterium]
MKRKVTLRVTTAVALFASGLFPPGQAARGQVIPPPTFVSLNQIPVPEPPNLFQFVKSKPAAIRLGKAFFWDMQVGSDGIQACATCHFSAGVDKRMKNSLHPGPDGSFQVQGLNQTLQPGDFPFHQRENPDFQASTVLRDSNDIVGSQGVRLAQFAGVVLGSAVESSTPLADPVFQLNGTNLRQVTGRNTPTNINAIFNFNNFWDGRAHFIFNGVSPFGPLDESAGIWFNRAGTLVKEKVAIEFASLASQAVGPPLSDVEMSYRGRTFPDIARKLLSLTPLGKQVVHPDDSVLGPLSNATWRANGTLSATPGLTKNYAQMIQEAFVDNLWNNTAQVTPEGLSQMEANFSLFWGLAVQLYEATLVSDQTPFDRFLGGEETALTPEQQDGFTLFFETAGCEACHGGTELTNASATAARFITNSRNGLIEGMATGSGKQAIYDNGYNNTASRPLTEDLGRGGDSPFTNPLTSEPLPLSFCALAELQAADKLPFETPLLAPEFPVNFPIANDGAFKVPGLRNVELTGPFFHNGGILSLEDVVAFYTRGGDFPEVNVQHLDPGMLELPVLQNAPEKAAAIVALMKSFTDLRVVAESAPFDHPELFIPEGEPEVLTRLPAKGGDGSVAPAVGLTLDPTPALTGGTTLQLGGTVDAGATVQVQVNDGAPSAAISPSATSWQSTVTLEPGVNEITVTASDPAGNSATRTATVVVSFSDGCFDGTGETRLSDALKAMRMATGQITPTADNLLHGDVAPPGTPDGRIDTSDALMILKKAVGLIDF